MRRYIRTLSVCALTLVAGCSESTPESMFENYLYRLGNSLSVDIPKAAEISPRPLFPLRRTRIIPTTEIREGLFDALELNACQLLPLIAERNSSLGKVYPPSLKLNYEIRFFNRLSQCRSNLHQSSTVTPELAIQLDELYVIKRQNLAAELWNGIYNSEALEQNFSRDYTPLPLIDNGSSDSSIKALKTLSSLTTLNEKSPFLKVKLPDDLGEAYEVLFKNRTGPQILSSLQLITRDLNQASQMLETRLSGRPLCFNNTPSNKSKILQNVFFKYYIGEVQPYMAYVHRHADRWLQTHLVLMDSYQQLELKIPHEMETYRLKVLSKSEPYSLWQNYIEARDKHTRSWQKILKLCGLMPTTRD